MYPLTDYYVYGYTDPTSSDPYFYIGKGHGDRYLKHFQWNLLQQQTHFYKKLKNLLLQDVLPIVSFLKSGLAEQEAISFEIEMIAKFGRIDLGTGCLCNHTEGGDGASGHVVSKITRELIGKAHLGNQFAIGHTHDLESRLKMSASHSKRTQEMTEKNRAGVVAHKGRSVCAIHPITKEIVFTLDFISQGKERGYSPSAIGDVLHGRKKSHRGYFWKYAEDCT